jgi:hypothetical protein
MAGLITRLEENPALRVELSLRNRRGIIDQFGAQRVILRLAELLKDSELALTFLRDE